MSTNPDPEQMVSVVHYKQERIQIVLANKMNWLHEDFKGMICTLKVADSSWNSFTIQQLNKAEQIYSAIPVWSDSRCDSHIHSI